MIWVPAWSVLEATISITRHLCLISFPPLLPLSIFLFCESTNPIMKDPASWPHPNYLPKATISNHIPLHWGLRFHHMKASKQIKSMVWGELRFIIGISEGQIPNADVPREPWIIILYFEINNTFFKLRARKKTWSWYINYSFVGNKENIHFSSCTHWRVINWCA